MCLSFSNSSVLITISPFGGCWKLCHLDLRCTCSFYKTCWFLPLQVFSLGERGGRRGGERDFLVSRLWLCMLWIWRFEMKYPIKWSIVNKMKNLKILSFILYVFLSVVANIWGFHWFVLLLQCKPAVSRSRSSSLSLTVESALESFDFLNTSDFDDEDGGGEEVCNGGGGADSVFSDTEVEKNR